MLIVISKKDFTKNAKKLVEKKDYLIADAMDSDDAELTKYSQVVTMDGFAPPHKLVKAKLEDDTDSIGIDDSKVKKLEKKFFKSKEFITATMACIKDVVTSHDAHNIFIVLNNKAYKAYGKKIVKMIHKLAGIHFDIAATYGDVDEDKSILKKTLKDSKIKDLSKVIKNFESHHDKKSKD